MLKFKKILCPTDFSEPSYEALKVAEELAIQFSGELYLVNVISPIPTLTSPTDPSTFNISLYRRELEAYAEKSLQDVIKNKLVKKPKVHTAVGYGDAANEILSIAEKENVDLIVIATHGRTGWRHLVFGSVAEKVVRHANHAVLTIRAPH
jgi:nucleotide-binding universal stress UspA family protein